MLAALTALFVTLSFTYDVPSDPDVIGFSLGVCEINPGDLCCREIEVFLPINNPIIQTPDGVHWFFTVLCSNHTDGRWSVKILRGDSWPEYAFWAIDSAGRTEVFNGP